MEKLCFSELSSVLTAADAATATDGREGGGGQCQVGPPVIFCGHFPDGAEKFTLAEFENESRAQWYLRQMLGSANFHAGPVMAFMSGNLCYQIEHHCFPDLPSNRYSEIAVPLRELCEKYDLPYIS